MAITQRTYLWATLGAAMVWIGLLMALWRIARVPAIFVATALLVAGLGAQLFQFHHYVNISERQRSVLRQIVENLGPDEISDRMTLLVLDGTAQMGHTWLFLDEGLRFTLSYIYGKPFGRFEVCRLPSMEWQRIDALGRKGTCVEDAAGWTFVHPASVSGPGVAPSTPAPPRRLLTQDAVLVTLPLKGDAAGNQVLEEHRRRLRGGNDPVSRRYRSILEARSPARIEPMFQDQFIGQRYRWDFGRWWNLDVPPRGAGWRDVEWNGNGLSQTSEAWKVRPTSELYFELVPTAGEYRVHGDFDQFASDAARRSMTMRVNGKEIEFRWVSYFGFEAEVPAGYLVGGTNRLEFVSEVDNQHYGLSARLVSVTVEARK